MNKSNMTNESMSAVYLQIVQEEKAFYPLGGQLTTKLVDGIVITRLSEWVFDEEMEKEIKVPRAYYEVLLDDDWPGAVVKLEAGDLPAEYENAPTVLDITLMSEVDEGDQKYSEFKIPHITINYLKDLEYVLRRQVLESAGFQGKMEIMHNENVIFTVVYDYAGAAEIQRGNELMTMIQTIANQFYRVQCELGHPQYYPVNKAA